MNEFDEMRKECMKLSNHGLIESVIDCFNHFKIIGKFNNYIIEPITKRNINKDFCFIILGGIEKECYGVNETITLLIVNEWVSFFKYEVGIDTINLSNNCYLPITKNYRIVCNKVGIWFKKGDRTLSFYKCTDLTINEIRFAIDNFCIPNKVHYWFFNTERYCTFTCCFKTTTRRLYFDSILNVYWCRFDNTILRFKKEQLY